MHSHHYEYTHTTAAITAPSRVFAGRLVSIRGNHYVGGHRTRCMRRRALLRSLPAAALAGVAGCAGIGRPSVRMDSGRATLHPAGDLYVANGLQPDGDSRLFVTAVPDDAAGWVGPDADDSLAEPLRTTGGDRFHVVVQLRSSPEAPISLWPDPGSSFEWATRSTLRARVDVEPWGSLDRIDDEAERERLRSADELVFTAVWTLVPGLDSLPEDVELVLASRG